MKLLLFFTIHLLNIWKFMIFTKLFLGGNHCYYYILLFRHKRILLWLLMLLGWLLHWMLVFGVLYLNLSMPLKILGYFLRSTGRRGRRLLQCLHSVLFWCSFLYGAFPSMCGHPMNAPTAFAFGFNSFLFICFSSFLLFYVPFYLYLCYILFYFFTFCQ